MYSCTDSFMYLDIKVALGQFCSHKSRYRTSHVLHHEIFFYRYGLIFYLNRIYLIPMYAYIRGNSIHHN